MKSLIFDSGPIISFSMNNLLWLFPELKNKFNGKFYITNGVKREIIDNPLNSKKFKFEALQVLKEFDNNILELYKNKELNDKTYELLELANHLFNAHGKEMNIVQYAEMEVLAAAIISESDAIVIDERTTRLLLENPEKLRKILQKKLHTSVNSNKDNLKKFKALTKGLKVIRSIELVLIAYEKGLLNNYVLNIKDPKKNLLDGLLWGLKLNGCSVSSDEINKVITLESR